MPKIAELTDRIIGLVAEELDLTKESILSKSRKAEIVDARHMVVKLLHRNSVYPSRIAVVFGLSPRNVRSIITEFDRRISTNRLLREIYNRLKEKI